MFIGTYSSCLQEDTVLAMQKCTQTFKDHPHIAFSNMDAKDCLMHPFRSLHPPKEPGGLRHLISAYTFNTCVLVHTGLVNCILWKSF